MSEFSVMSSKPPEKRSVRVAVLYGGRSSEREVSLATGKAIARALGECGHQVTLIDPQDPNDPSQHIDLLSILRQIQVELVFNALHGTYGEDGCLQGLLDWSGIAYTGAGIKASAVAMDKDMSRRLFESAGVPVAQAITWRAGEPFPTQELPPSPWALKPLSEGSSVGIVRCLDQAMLREHLGKIQKGTWLIESWLQGVELSVMVLDGRAWGGVEIVPSSGWYDYDAKYVRGDTQYFCPPRLSEARLKEIYQLAEKAYKALECRGVARVDFISSDSSLIALEINTSPGMTATSLVPKVAQSCGVSFGELCERLMYGALQTQREC